MGQCVPSSETSEILWKKSNVFRKISDVFQKISNVFGKKSNVFAARSEVGTLVGVFLGANAGQKRIAWSIRWENGRLRGGGAPFFSLSVSPKWRWCAVCVKICSKKGVNCCWLEGYEEIGEGCESKKCRIPVGRAHAHAREGGIKELLGIEFWPQIGIKPQSVIRSL